MILSVSRRTDIPNYYSEWFYNRIKEGFLYVRNPMNAHQISEIKITPDVVDCIVFWTKNPLPMIKRLDEIKDYNYYFQFTLTGYGNDVEINVPNKKTKMIPVFQELSEKIGMTEKNLSNIERGLQVPALNSFLRLLDVLNVSLTEFGISTSDTKNENRDELIKEIYLASPNEIEAYLKIIKTIKNIKG